MAAKKRMPTGFFKDIHNGTNQIDRLVREDPVSAVALNEIDVIRMMRAKPVKVDTQANGTRNLIWQQSGAAVGIAFTGDHRFNRIYYRTGI